MQSTGQVSFVYGGSVAGMIASFPEIESYLRLTEKEATHIEIENQRFPQQVIVEARQFFLPFFPVPDIVRQYERSLDQAGLYCFE